MKQIHFSQKKTNTIPVQRALLIPIAREVGFKVKDKISTSVTAQEIVSEDIPQRAETAPVSHEGGLTKLLKTVEEDVVVIGSHNEYLLFGPWPSDNEAHKAEPTNMERWRAKLDNTMAKIDQQSNSGRSTDSEGW